MKILVTGATGFVGGRLVSELLGRDQPVRALVRDRNKTAALRNAGADVVVGDLRDRASFRHGLADVSIIYHCAALVGHFSKQEIYETNLVGLKNLLETCREARGKRVVFVSTLNVLGTCDLNPATEDLPHRFSRDPAADVKIDAERLIADYADAGVDVTIVRPGFIYGPGDTRNLPRLTDAIAQGKFVFMGSRDNFVPIVHVDDVVQALMLASAPAARGRTYNVTDGSRTTIGELVTYLAELLGCPVPGRLLSYRLAHLVCVVFDVLNKTGLRRRPGPITRPGLRFLGTSRLVDIGRACNELGYAPRVDFRQGMATALEWLKANGLLSSGSDRRVRSAAATTAATAQERTHASASSH